MSKIERISKRIKFIEKLREEYLDKYCISRDSYYWEMYLKLGEEMGELTYKLRELITTI